MKREWEAAALLIMATALAVGVLLILVASVTYGNYWPLFTIATHGFALMFPMLCDGYNEIGEDDGDDLFLRDCKLIGWFMLAVFFMSGYALPIVMYHSGQIPTPVIYLVIAGGTLVWVSIMLFMRLFCCTRGAGEDYDF